MKHVQSLFRIILILMVFCMIPSCDLIEGLKGDSLDSYYISSIGSLSTPELSGTLKNGDKTDSNLRIYGFNASESKVNLILGNNIMVNLTFSIPAKKGTFTIVPDTFSNDEVDIYADGFSSKFKSGTATVIEFSKDIKDETRGKISFRLQGNGEFGGSDPRFPPTPISFDFRVSFDNRDDPPYTPPVSSDDSGGSGGGSGGSGGSGGGSGGSGGSSVSYCTTTYQGPTGAPQRDGFCQAAWLYLCKNGLSPDSREVKEYCRLYAQMNQITTPMQNCPYCR
ncbi:hypothetical protein [Algoriphagus sp. NBT04N3]|jgi:uncharacterized membrane protein YgcG|uniref:hypothetical protein n=1 Tax=Algoriphagus sp. NBT04N3 TaxID=2705473 RepID=UPI001C62CE01|nr:hypothetical protein [Algoriphagus sp. NBT04N3]